jgi:hypothetical protein
VELWIISLAQTIVEPVGISSEWVVRALAGAVAGVAGVAWRREVSYSSRLEKREERRDDDDRRMIESIDGLSGAVTKQVDVQQRIMERLDRVEVESRAVVTAIGRVENRLETLPKRGT